MIDAPLIALIHRHRELFLDRAVVRLRTTIPSYSRIDLASIRANVAALLDDLLATLETDQSEGLRRRLIEHAQARAAQGFPIADYLRALFQMSPLTRELLREVGPKNDPSFPAAFAALEDRLLVKITEAAHVYTDLIGRRLESKNLELNRLNQQLQAQSRALNVERAEVSRALASANEFNQRVLESLSSGVMVVSPDARITLYTERMAEIFGLPAEEVLGRDGREVFAGFSGLEPEAIIRTVREWGRYPLTKLQVQREGGPRKTIFAQAQRLYDPSGNIDGTVVVVDDVSERERLIDSFSRYVSKDLLNRLLARPEPLALESEKRVCTVLFADIRGFTGLAEQMPPERLHQLLNQFLHVMIAGIFESGGFIDKFVGDKVMALFTSPLSESAAAIAALSAAQKILAGIVALNAERQASGEAAIAVGIGINTGEVVVGNVGDEARMDFTAIGDAVNVADRLQSLAQGGEILVGKDTAAHLAERLALTDAGAHQLKGRSLPVQIFRVT